MEREKFVLVLEPVIHRFGKGEIAGAVLADGEILEFFERLDVDLRKFREFLARQRAVAVLVEPLRRKGRKHLVEGPDVAHRRHLPVLKYEFAFSRHQHMRMRKRGRAETREQRRDSHETEGAKRHIASKQGRR
jgi:hypothetical protein